MVGIRPVFIIVLVIFLLLIASTRLPKTSKKADESADNLQRGFEDIGSTKTANKKTRV